MPLEAPTTTTTCSATGFGMGTISSGSTGSQEQRGAVPSMPGTNRAGSAGAGLPSRPPTRPRFPVRQAWPMPAPSLLLTPGLGLGPEAWAPTMRGLAGGRRARVTPAPGYGVPARRARDLSPAALGEDVLECLPEGSDPVVLAGHSASCQVVVQAALAAPARVSGLVLVGPTTDPRAVTWPRIARRWLRTARHEDPRQVPLLVRLYLRTGP